MGTISLVLKLEKFMTYVKFHVIDAATSYNVLFLGAHGYMKIKLSHPLFTNA
jgi:hypothetical protein